MTSRSKFVIQFGSTVWQQNVENVILVPQNLLEHIVIHDVSEFSCCQDVRTAQSRAHTLADDCLHSLLISCRSKTPPGVGCQVEQDGKLPFLDLLLVRTDNDGLKFLVYRKPTHADQYLNFSSHHPIEHKLSMVRTLMERSQCMVSDVVDKKHEDAHIEDALRVCGYPEWSFDKVKSQIE